MEIRGHTFSLASRPGTQWDFNIIDNATGSIKYLGDVSGIVGAYDRGSEDWLDAVDRFLSDEALIYEELFPELSEYTLSWKLREDDVDLRMLAIKSPAVRKRLLETVNGQLYDLVTNRYFQSIPLDRLLGIVEDVGFVFDPEEVPFALLGREGRANIPAKLPGFKRDYALTITWYKMITGTYEVIAYFN